jgi:hypothetical protein
VTAAELADEAWAAGGSANSSLALTLWRDSERVGGAVEGGVLVAEDMEKARWMEGAPTSTGVVGVGVGV